MTHGRSEWHLEEEVAENVISTIMSFGSALERLAQTADKLAVEDEENLRDLLLFILNANYQGAATGETFLGNGKTDVLLRWRDKNAFIGECKFWKGPRKFLEAVEQLIGRYTVWRDTRVAIILFIRDTVDITAAIDKARTQLADYPRTMQAISPDEPAKRSDYLVHAAGDQQRVIRLSLLPVIIPRVGSIRSI